MILIRLLLAPFALVYGGIMQLRNLLYNHNIFKTAFTHIPVISIGNITAGGTGKTPFTIFLAQKLIEQGKKVAVVSRGYGRKSKGFHIVSLKNNAFSVAEIYGDEPVLISAKIPGAIVAVSEKRIKAIRYLEKNYNIDVILLDDGFQHRAVGRNLDIVLEKNMHLLKNRMPIPSGVLREFKGNLKRADIIVEMDCPEKEIDSETFICTTQIQDFQAANGLIHSIDSLTPKECCAFSGIAHPDLFERSLEDIAISPLKFVPYSDHYHFEKKDVEYLLQICKDRDVSILLCTEKDLVKIKPYFSLLESHGISLLAARQKLQLDRDVIFSEIIQGVLDS